LSADLSASGRRRRKRRRKDATPSALSFGAAFGCTTMLHHHRVYTVYIYIYIYTHTDQLYGIQHIYYILDNIVLPALATGYSCANMLADGR